MSRVLCIPTLGLLGLLAAAGTAEGQATPYIGFAYPAGGQQGTTFQVRLGGQRIDGADGAVVSGEGVSVKLLHYYRKLVPTDTRLLREQLGELRRASAAWAKARKARAKKAQAKQGQAKQGQAKQGQAKQGQAKQGQAKQGQAKQGQAKQGQAGKSWAKAVAKGYLPPEEKKRQAFIKRIEKRMAGYVNRPACASLANIAIVEVTIDADAEPGPRELRLVTPRGVTNPVVFFVGQLPEVSRKPMKTATFQVLGKEHLAQRKRPEEEVEVPITVPCTMNGQIASGEVNRYRFEARKGQRLVITVDARALVPYIADAVPGWFQPVITLRDANGRELAFQDDFRFKPDPTMLFEVPQDGEYLLEITDAIYRGREDFVYRLSVGEIPYLTSIFPLGGRAGEPVSIEMTGWNLEGATLDPPSKDTGPGIYRVVADKSGFASNQLPFVLDTLPECLDREANDRPSEAQKVKLPMIVNGRIDRSDDWDVFQFEGRAGDTVVAEIHARRLDSPLDSILKLTDESGKLVAVNDDHEDPGCGLNTHHADSYLKVELPADGTYYVHLGDTARAGGKEYVYRLRISPPRPDFELRLVPSGGGLRGKNAAGVTVYALRKDGFDGAIKLGLKDPPEGFSAAGWVGKDKDSGRITVKTSLTRTDQPVSLNVEGRAKIGGAVVSRKAVPAEDRMQAFLWRHLVPAQDLKVLVYKPSYKKPPKRVSPPPPEKKEPEATSDKSAEPPKFSKKQVAGRLRQLARLYEEWLLTDDFYLRKVAECEAAL